MSNKVSNLVALTVVLLAVLFIGVRQVSTNGQEEILVLCGGSMRGAVEELKRRYEEIHPDRIVTTYGGSGELCAQILHTGKGDIYVCHDPFMPWAHDKGVIREWGTLASLDVVIAVPKGNPKNIQTLEDLARPGLRVGIGNQVYSSSGQIIKHMLADQSFGPGILKNVRVETKGHQQRCNDVVMGTLDATTVWNAVAHLYRDKLDVIAIPKTYVDTITTATYGVLDLKYTKVTAGVIAGAADRPAVKRFYAFMMDEGRDILRDLGFSPVQE